MKRTEAEERGCSFTLEGVRPARAAMRRAAETKVSAAYLRAAGYSDLVLLR